MSDVINVADPRGKNIKCTRDCWYGHVLNGHPFLKKSLKAVRTTITKPDFIHNDRFSLTVENYYRKVSGPNGDSFYRITVEFNSGSGEVRTVYKCSRAKNGEIQIWP